MKLGVLFSGGKDSTYAALLAKRAGHELACFLTVDSENENSFMFHTPAIKLTKLQSKLADVPFLLRKTNGKKELELFDLEELIKDAIERYNIDGIVTGAVESVYQASRVQEICDKLEVQCFNPLWQKNQWELLDELIESGFDMRIVGVFAYPFDGKMIGRKIDKKFVEDIGKVHKRLRINPAGEGGEFESLVVNCPLFKKPLGVNDIKAVGAGNSWRGEVKLKNG
ncbi:TIGR00289 family protein [Candidatus Pacearchaeota archaeon]|nr:TIGR00289 family protein [Candidatus Pacearchaeota archaeon]|tara:strand:+ start:8088 stop:8762 length:675 start_codon:yes stop_codon:yes gene_type:complete